MGKSTKDKRDIYYRQGKSEGYRARSAYKLLHLHEQYGFLGNSESFALDSHEATCAESSSSDRRTNQTETEARSNGEGNGSARQPGRTFKTPTRVVDLCAAPGSWSQVLSRRLANVPNSHLVAVDLQAMAPLPGVTQIIGDITTPATAAAVSRALSSGPTNSNSQGEGGKSGEREGKGAKAELIVCDGAPDVTGLHDLDEYLQSQLLVAAIQITFRLLESGGTFVAKIFTQNPQSQHHSHSHSHSYSQAGSATSNTKGGILNGAKPSTSADLLVNQLRPFFETVDVAKPRSSRVGSVEHFLVCLNFRPPTDQDLDHVGADIFNPFPATTTAAATQNDAKGPNGTTSGLADFAQRLKSQSKNPSCRPSQHEQDLAKSIPFVAHGDLSGFDD